MLAKLKRAKSFVHRTKHEEEKFESDELGLNETAHLRRNIPINHAVLEKHKKLCMSNESLSTLNRRKLQKEASMSQEYLQDGMIEELRRLNFGDSYSKKDITVLTGCKEPSEAFLRRHPAYVSDRHHHRKSFRTEKPEKYSHCRTSGNVASNFDRKNVAYCSERSYLKTPSSNNQPESTLLFGSGDDFLLKRKCPDSLNTIAKRTPGYVPEGNRPKKKSDILEKTGLRSLFQKLTRHEKESDSRDISDSGFSTGSSSASYSFEGVGQHPQNRRYDEMGSRTFSRPGNCSNTSTVSSCGSVRADLGEEFKEELISYLEKNIPKTENHSVGPKSNCKESNRMHSVDMNISKREPPTATATNRFITGKSVASISNNKQSHATENNKISSNVKNIAPRGSEEQSRKRQHFQTKSSFDRSQQVYLSPRASRETWKQTGNKFKEDGDPRRSER